jgi:hypothetical protein
MLAPMTCHRIDREEIAKFATAIFRYVSDGQTISLRTYPDNGDPRLAPTLARVIAELALKTKATR